MSGFDRQQARYRERVAARYAALRAARVEGKQDELAAYRRLHRDRTRPRSNRRPALCLAAVFLALVIALVFVARASGVAGSRDHSQLAENHFRLPAGPSGIDSGHPDRRHRIRSIICSVFTGSRCGPAIRVAKCETGGTFYPRALGSAGERGLFQIHPVHFRTFDKRRLFEPRYNARAAFRLSRGGRDWSPWTCQP